MRRSVGALFSWRALRQATLVPRAVRFFDNWFELLLSVAGLSEKVREFRLRAGEVIRTHESIDSVTVSVVWLRKDYGEPPTGGVVLDIGANIGAYTLYAALGSRTCRVYAFEPMPANFRVLADNVRANGLSNRVEVHALGIAGTSGLRRLYSGGGSPYHSVYTVSDQAEYTEIETVTLDAIFELCRIGRCDLLKMDCEGAEFEALYSASPACLSKIQEIRMEYHNRREPADYNLPALESFLRTHGFRRTFLDEDAQIIWLRRDATEAVAAV